MESREGIERDVFAGRTGRGLRTSNPVRARTFQSREMACGGPPVGNIKEKVYNQILNSTTMTNTRKSRLTAASSLLGVLLLFLAGPASSARSLAKPSWNVELVLEVKGRYRMEDKDGPRIGHYAFSVRWKGKIERDDDDYLLLHNESALEDWKADESPSPKIAGRFLDSPDFAERPVFRFNYILAEDEEVQIDFAMEGFPIPVNPSISKFPLALPASAGTAPDGSVSEYDRFLIQGSNRIRLSRAVVESGPAKGSFAWKWKRNSWGLEQAATIFCSQSHEARVSVSITPVPSR
jgi:hypothetical protein